MISNQDKVRCIDLPHDIGNGSSATVKYCINSSPASVSHNGHDKSDVEPGNLWKLSEEDAPESPQFGTWWRPLEFVETPKVLFYGEERPLSIVQARILLALPVNKRVDFYRSTSFIVAERCQVGDTVLVSDPQLRNNLVPDNMITCEVRFKGVLPERTEPNDRNGLYFGLVSRDPCNEGQPRLVSMLPQYHTMNLLRVTPDEERSRRIILADARWLAPDDKWLAPLSLTVGDRVVLKLEADQNEHRRGIVRWLGSLDANRPCMAGVEFDREIPNSNFGHDNQQLFAGKPGYCRIVEESSLVREKEFDGRIQQCRANASTHQSPRQQQQAAFDDRSLEAKALMESRGIQIGSQVYLLMLDKVAMVMWFGFIPGENELVVGVAIDNDDVDFDGAGTVPVDKVLAIYPDAQKDLFFTYHGLLQLPRDSHKDQASNQPIGAQALANRQQFDELDCPTIVGPTVLPIQPDDIPSLVGRNRGIQGHHNSCYLDSTLFAMFATVDAFDCVLDRGALAKDLDSYDEIRNCLREGIVNCLRSNKFVSAGQVLKLRRHLNDLDVIPGMMSEEKDPEEFINLLLDHALRHEPFIQLSTGQSCHVLQLFLDRADLPFEQQQQHNENSANASSQQHVADTETLLHLSLIQSNIQLSEPPKCLILQMPRSGKSYKMFHRILPVLQLNITNLIPGTARACAVCGYLATIECHQCFLKHDSGRDYTYCDQCFKSFSDHKRKGQQVMTHDAIKIKYPNKVLDEYNGAEKKMVESQTIMDLLAVVCIRTSHYVCFLRAQPDDWLFFDSMADREGGFDNGFNIPEVTRVPGLEAWLDRLKLNTNRGFVPPEQVNRLLEDCYLCFYGNPRVVDLGA